MEMLLDLEENFKGTRFVATIVLTKYFDYLCNDDCLVSGRTIITTLGGW